MILQRVAATHDASVDAAHHERREPAAEPVVVERLQGVPLGAEIRLRLAVWTQRIGIGQHAAARRVLLHRVDRRSRRVDRPSARAALHGLDHEERLLQVPMTARLGLLVQEQRADVGWDRVEAAGVDDPRPAGLSRGVRGVDRPAHEQHLAGEVGVMRPRGRTGLDERLAVLEVGADRGRDDARRRRQRRDRIAILAVGDHEGPVDAELGARLLELGLGAAAERDPDVGWRLPGEVLGREHSHEAGRPVDDDVVVADGLGHISNLPSREVCRHRCPPPQVRRRFNDPKVPIGATGFEPATFRPPAECATKLRHAPWSVRVYDEAGDEARTRSWSLEGSRATGNTSPALDGR